MKIIEVNFFKEESEEQIDDTYELLYTIYEL